MLRRFLDRIALRLELLFYAASCVINVGLVRRPEDTSEGESTSGRAFWEARFGKFAGHWSWVWGVRLIDGLADLIDWILRRKRTDGMGHCERADLRDYHRAKEKVRRFEGRNLK